MIKKLSILSVIILTISSCFEVPDNGYIPELDVPAGFDWKSIEARKINLPQMSSILDEHGDTIASYLADGQYDLFVGKSTSLTINAEEVPAEIGNQVVALNAGGGSIKHRVYFPAKGQFATVMFEDLFPSKGDMDMNDIAFGLNIQYDLDNKGRVSVIHFTIQPRAVGSSYDKIGLAVNFSGYPVSVSKVTRTDDPGDLSNFFNVTLKNGWHTEELNNSKSVVIPITGNFRKYFEYSPELFYNVRNIDPPQQTTTFTVSVELNSNSYSYSMFSFLESVNSSQICIDLFAVFGKREKEVHFKGQLPTERFSTAYFNYTAPKTDFSTIDNWIWAIICDKSIRHPQEQIKIYDAYPNFKVWAEQWSLSGENRSDWYNPIIINNLYTAIDFNYYNND